jgi:hypothetical protein
MTKRLLVSIVDDDESIREALPDLLRELGYSVQAFSSADEFLASDCVGSTLRRHHIPIVFITANSRCRSGPDIPGIERSRMRHLVLTETRRSGGASSSKERRSAFSSHSVI